MDSKLANMTTVPVDGCRLNYRKAAEMTWWVKPYVRNIKRYMCTVLLYLRSNVVILPGVGSCFFLKLEYYSSENLLKLIYNETLTFPD